MVIFRAAGDVSVERQAQVRRGVMTADDLVGFARRLYFGQQFFVATRDAGIIHHLAQADDAVPRHCLGHFLRPDMRAGRLETRRGWDAGWHLHPNVDRLPGGLVHHHLDALQAEDVGDLVRVHEHAGRAMRDDGAHELGHGQHARFDVHVPVQQTWDQVLAARLHH